MAKSRGSTRRAKSPSSKAESLTLDAEAVRYWRLQRGLTQEALAAQRSELDGEIVSLSYAQVRRIESDGRCGPTSARILSALLDVSLARLSPRDLRYLPCGLPREPSADFVGRDAQIKAVLGALQERGSVRIAASIEGLPGIGKTELALQVCGLCEQERRFRIFWFDAEEPDLTRVWADVVAPHLGVEASEPDERARLALRAVEALSEPVLLVLDNVEAWTASRPWPRPRGRHLHWLVTTRETDLGGREFRHVGVPVLDASASEELMVRIAGPEVASRLGFQALIDALDGYTISVELAATFLRRFSDVSPRDYLERVQVGMHAEFEDEVGARSFYGQSLERALELLWERVPPRLRRAWQLAACFAQAPASPSLSDACGLDRRARAELREFMLIETASERGWSMHRLIRAFGLRAGSRQERDAARQAFLQGVAKLSNAMSQLDGFIAYQADRAHADAALAVLQEADSLGAAVRSDFVAAVASARHELGEYESAEGLLRDALRLTADCADRLDLVARIRCGLGEVHLSRGDWNAAKVVLEQALDASLPAFEDHRVVLELRNNLARVLALLGDLEEARRVQEGAVQQVESGKGQYQPDDLNMARAYLAQILYSQGDLEASLKIREALVESCLSSGEDSSSLAMYRSDLALTLNDLGRHAEARELWEASLASYTRIYGEDSLRVAMTRGNLTLAMLGLGELDEARDLTECALACEERLLGPEHPAVVSRRGNLAGVLFWQRDLERAMELFVEALRVSRRDLGDDHPQTVAYAVSLARIRQEQGDLPGAMELMQGAWGADQRAGRSRHPRALVRQRSFAELLRELGELKRARDLLADAVEGLSEGLGADHPDVALARAQLAEVLGELGEACEARKLAADALRVARVQPAGWRHAETIERISAAVAVDVEDP